MHPIRLTAPSPALKVFVYLLPALLLFSRAIADITVVLVAFTFLFISYKNQSWPWLKQSWFVAFLVFNAYLILLNLPQSSEPSESLKYVLTFIRWPLFAMALAYWIFDNSDIRRHFIISLSLIIAFVVADTLWQYLFGVDWFGIERFTETRLTGPFRSPIPGTMLLRLWFIVLFIACLVPWFKYTTVRQITSLMTIMSVGFVFTYLTGERMALILYCAGAAVVFITMLFIYRDYQRRLLSMVVIFVLSLGMIILISPDMLERSIMSISTKLSSFAESDYGLVFKAAWQVWQDNWWFGSGLHTYQSVCEQQQLLASTGMVCSHPHNLYLQLGAETGVVGLVLFLIMLCLLYKQVLLPCIKAKNGLQTALCFALLTVSFWPLSGGISVLSNWVAALVWLGVGWALAISRASAVTPHEHLSHTNR